MNTMNSSPAAAVVVQKQFVSEVDTEADRLSETFVRANESHQR